MGFSRQEYWSGGSGVPFPSLEGFPDPGMKPKSLVSPALASRILYHCAIWEAPKQLYSSKKLKKKINKRNRCSDCLGDLADDKKAVGGILCYFFLSRFTGIRRKDRHRTCTSFSVKKKSHLQLLMETAKSPTYWHIGFSGKDMLS